MQFCVAVRLWKLQSRNFVCSDNLIYHSFRRRRTISHCFSLLNGGLPFIQLGKLLLLCSSSSSSSHMFFVFLNAFNIQSVVIHPLSRWNLEGHLDWYSHLHCWEFIWSEKNGTVKSNQGFIDNKNVLWLILICSFPSVKEEYLLFWGFNFSHLVVNLILYYLLI